MAKGTTLSQRDLMRILKDAGYEYKHCGNGSHIKMEHEQISHSFTMSNRGEYQTNVLKNIFKDALLEELADEAQNGTDPKKMKKMAKRDFEMNAVAQRQPRLHTSPGVAA